MITLLRAWVGWTLSWVLFWPGHWTSYLMWWFDFAAPVLYPIYNWFMITSGNVQDWGGGFGAWQDVIDVDLEEHCATCGNEIHAHKMDCPIATGSKE